MTKTPFSPWREGDPSPTGAVVRVKKVGDERQTVFTAFFEI
jgi:hypothetical protein